MSISVTAQGVLFGRRICGYFHVFRKGARRRLAIGVDASPCRELALAAESRRPVAVDFTDPYEVSALSSWISASIMA